MKPIRILIIDDHSLFRSGIKLLLQRQKGFEVVGEAGNGLEGVKLAKRLSPDVVLLDLHMPGIGGVETIPLIKEEAPEAQVVMLTVSEDAEDLLDALHNGARGYLLKNIDTDYLLDSIRRANNGDSVMSVEMANRMADAMRALSDGSNKKIIMDTNKLSPRERDVIVMLAQGASNKEIARNLSLAESTVKIHVQGILRKLNLTSRVQAAVYAVENGLVDKS
ncbi:response regulator [Methylophaga nitratireducenticrescens]|uniref:Nitrate/nitrite response regulator protein n=1 Tax=Methylophaga nitratireducenticrescens TaxID=754476 RepID=I1XFX4_METNJ|nr:response regulator transcription factor [Methylophaga nitratireducenticrescens]AFI83293.1 DNA-binding response regulator [Methylophaga nitratireducenticrescens]AUZ83418.1 DNA-binding response regulator [Methylophaga nitratireducenticrescens]